MDSPIAGLVRPFALRLMKIEPVRVVLILRIDFDSPYGAMADAI